LIYFRGPSSVVAPLNRQWEIQEGLLRHLVLKVHPHLVEVVLEHAKAGPVQPQPQPAATAAGPSRDELDAEEIE
jgi:hypothetical protein